MKDAKAGAGIRQLKTRVKKKGKIKSSSRRWLERHLNDPYVHRANAEGMRSRAAYKLIEIKDKYKILQANFLDDDAPDRLIEALGGAPDVVLSDMAAPTTGHRRTDHLRTMHLCETAADFAVSVLKPGGHFLAKTFQGGAEGEVLTMLKQHFASVHHVKPPASRAESVELYILARNFKGRKAAPGGEEAAGEGPEA